MVITKKYFFLVLIGLFTLFTIRSGTFLQDPPVWPDEAIYADIVQNMQKEGRMGTDLWLDTIPGIQQHAFIYPSVFFFIYFLWFKVTSLTIAHQRVLSVIAGAMSLGVVYGIMKQIRFNSLIANLISLGLLSITYVYMKAAKVSRPEIFVLTFGLLSIYFFIKFLSQKNYIQLKYIIIASVCSSLAFLTHLIGVMFILSLLVSITFLHTPIIKKKQLLLVSISIFLMPITLWALQNIRVLNIFIQQTSIAYYRKTMEGTWLQSLYNSAPYFSESFNLFSQYLFSLTILILATFLVPITKRIFSKNDFDKFKTLIIFSYVIWFFTLFGKMFWYYVFPFPLTYILVSILLTISYKKYKPYMNFKSLRYLKYFTIGACLYLGFANIHIISSIVTRYKKNSYSYDRYIKDIIKNIPSNSHVFLSAIPSPYHGLFGTKNNYVLYQFPVYKITNDEYDRLLTSAEYVVYNGIHDNIVGTYIIQYIKQNRESSISIGSMDQYRAEIIKLVSLDKRKKVI